MLTLFKKCLSDSKWLLGNQDLTFMVSKMQVFPLWGEQVDSSLPLNDDTLL